MTRPCPLMHDISHETQLKEWLGGHSLHRKLPPPVLGGECVPDFSCCMPDLLASLEERKAYMAGTQAVRNKWLGVFLGRAIEHSAKMTGKKPPKIHMVDGEGELSKTQ